jgi:hypothetical protein
MRRQVASRAADGCEVGGPGPDRLGDDLGGDGGQRAVRVGGRTDAAALLGDHGGDPGGQVAEVVGQVGVVADDHALVAEVAVGPEGLSAQEVVAKAVHAKVLDQFGGVIWLSDVFDIFSPPTSR